VRVFTGTLDSPEAIGAVPPAVIFWVRNESETAKIVVRMQHPPTTFLETVRTPKKAADA
jgi:hypothetical protein